ncbi:YkvI family membrane protein [Sphingobium boeckii]|uniref:Putative membrane protein YkvI n=1 Tax=Sphingobium boeckii TaxID=1082345 RepID=A0A7W9EFH0_9SPHN|nr:hypothetical protein [Sphingobium boeckii]MBB5685686.1 putative membrane protein YkvI [Sphingobium boeckii]
MARQGSSFVDRILLPGLAFKACVIGGGYATGRELVEYFLKNGPANGLLAMIVVTIVWSVVCALTFLFAFVMKSYNYQDFFRHILGRFAIVFEILYLASIVLLLAVFGAAAGEIGFSLFGAPRLAGTMAMVAAILAVTYSGQKGVEELFKYVSILLYLVYAIFLVVTLSRFGGEVAGAFALPAPPSNWLFDGLTFSAYNVLAAVLILPVLRHQTRARDAVVSGLLSGPLAMIPAILFFICLLPFYPTVLSQPLPSDYVLQALGSPMLRFAFQTMIFFALLESSVGSVQAFQARISALAERSESRMLGQVRWIFPLVITIGSIFIAEGIGLITLIAKGYRLFGYAIVLVYLIPLFAIALPKLRRLKFKSAEGNGASVVGE